MKTINDFENYKQIILMHYGTVCDEEDGKKYVYYNSDGKINWIEYEFTSDEMDYKSETFGIKNLPSGNGGYYQIYSSFWLEGRQFFSKWTGGISTRHFRHLFELAKENKLI